MSKLITLIIFTLFIATLTVQSMQTPATSQNGQVSGISESTACTYISSYTREVTPCLVFEGKNEECEYYEDGAFDCPFEFDKNSMFQTSEKYLEMFKD